MDVRRLLYKNVEGKVEDLLEYVQKLERERDEALTKVKEWNKDAEIQAAEQKTKELYKKLSQGFNPDDKQWKKIEKWEDRHIKKYHRPSMFNKIVPMKCDPNMPDFEYGFSYTPLGPIGSVTCRKCQKKMLKRSLGNPIIYDELCKKYNVDFFFGEV